MGKIKIDEEFCKGCSLCINFCPQKLIRMANHVSAKGYRPAEAFDPQGKCSGCAICAQMCPDAAITVFQEKIGREKK